MNRTTYIGICIALGCVIIGVFVYFNTELSRYVEGEVRASQMQGANTSYTAQHTGSSISPKPTSSPTPVTTVSPVPAETGAGSVKDPVNVPVTQGTATTTEIVYFVRTVPFVDCDQVTRKTRTIPATTTPAHAALSFVFAEDLKPLAPAFKGVSIKNGRAIVNFDASALNELNSTACQQTSVKTPIERTLLQFNTIRAVDYAIDGVIKEDWDA